MIASTIVSKEVEDIVSSCTIGGKIIFFWKEVGISYLEDEEMVVLEVCLSKHMIHMAISPKSSFPYFCFNPYPH